MPRRQARMADPARHVCDGLQTRPTSAVMDKIENSAGIRISNAKLASINKLNGNSDY